jgi:hypothetical protein
MRRLRHLVATLAILVAPIVVASPALARSPFAGIDCSGAAAQSAVCEDRNKTKDPLTGNDGLLVKIANIIAIIAGVAAVIIIVLAGLRFITSGGSSEDVAGARRTIIYAAIGLVVIVIGRTLIVFVLSKL